MLANFRRAPDPMLSISRYQALAPGYDASCRFIGEIRGAALEALQMRGDETVFDVACGTGATPCAVAEKVGPRGHAIGIEHSPSMAALARTRIAARGLPGTCVAFAGNRLQSWWWAAPINLWVRDSSARFTWAQTTWPSAP